MSRTASLAVEINVNTDAAWRGYEQWKARVEANPPRVQLTTSPGEPGQPLTTAPPGRTATFGGNVTTAPEQPVRMPAPPGTTVLNGAVTTAPPALAAASAEGGSLAGLTASAVAASQLRFAMPEGYVPPHMRRPLDTIIAENNAALASGDKTASQALFAELKGSYGVFPEDRADLARADREYTRAQRAGQAASERAARAQAAQEARMTAQADRNEARFQRNLDLANLAQQKAEEAEGAAPGFFSSLSSTRRGFARLMPGGVARRFAPLIAGYLGTTMGASIFAGIGVAALATRLTSEGISYHRARVAGEAMTLDEQLEQQEGIVGGMTTGQYIGGKLLSYTGLYEDPDAQKRELDAARLSRQSQDLTDALRLRNISAREANSSIGLRGFAAQQAALNNELASQQRDFQQQRQSTYRDTSFAGNLARQQIDVAETLATQGTKAQLGAVARDAAYAIGASDIGAGRDRSISMGMSSLDADRHALVEKQAIDLQYQMKTDPTMVPALRRSQSAALAALDFSQFNQRASFFGGIGYSTLDSMMRGSGNFRAADRASIQRENFNEMMGADGWQQRLSIFIDGATRLNSFDQQRARDDAARLNALNASNAAAFLGFGGQTRAAREADVAAQFVMRAGSEFVPIYDAAGNITGFNPTDAGTPSATVKAFNTSFQNAIKQSGIGFMRESRRLDTTLGAERSSLFARMANPNAPPEVSEAYEIGAQGLNRARDLIHSGHRGAAAQAERNSLMQLNLLQRDYFLNFRGVQVDPRLIETQGGRNSENVDSVIQAIEKAANDLKDGFAQAIKDAVDQGN